MGLFVDGPAATITDLTDQDSGLLDTALSTGINVSIKLRLAMEEIRTDLEFWLTRIGSMNLVWRQTLRIEQIVVTPPLRQWEIMQALAIVYRDAYFSQLVDRYQAKWKQFDALARMARESFLAEGIGIVGNPIKRAAPPLLGTTPGPQKGGTFYACIAWINAANQEGAPSVPSSITVSDGNLMTVAAAMPAPNAAVGFNVYAGTALDAMSKQNDTALPISGAYLYVPGQVNPGILPGNGQAPDFIRQLPRSVLRG